MEVALQGHSVFTLHPRREGDIVVQLTSIIEGCSFTCEPRPSKALPRSSDSPAVSPERRPGAAVLLCHGRCNLAF